MLKGTIYTPEPNLYPKAAYDALAFVTDLFSKLEHTEELTVKKIKETTISSMTMIIILYFSTFIVIIQKTKYK